MEKKDEPIIMYDSPEAAQVKTVTGWVSRTGRWWAKDEHMARWEGCTHKLCECGAVTSKNYITCESCRAKKWNETYLKYPFKEWDGKDAVYDHVSDKYFFSEDDIEDYLNDQDEGEEIKPEDMQLVLCKPIYLSQINWDNWSDDMAEDQELPDELVKLVEQVNTFCQNYGPMSYTPDNIRTEYKREPAIDSTLKPV